MSISRAKGLNYEFILRSAMLYSSDGFALGTTAVFQLYLKKSTSSTISIIYRIKPRNSNLVNHYGSVKQIHSAVK